MSSEKWMDVWNRRKLSDHECSTLQELIYLDGFDCGAGKIDENNWNNYIMYIKSKIGIASDDSIFEVGCGSGAFLYLFFVGGQKVGGIDYSEPLIEKAKSIFTGMNFKLCEASNLDTDERFDIVISNGAFHYFKSYEYANVVLEKMLTKAKSRIAVLEIPDIATMDESENARRGMLPPEEYDKKYKGLEHLYYEREWFCNFARKNRCSCSISGQNIRGYGNNKFRFNCIIEKLI